MNDKYIKMLEYNKIIDTLSSFAVTYLGKEKCKNLLPSFEHDVVSSRVTSNRLCFFFA